jgi:hypothetical protein
MLIEWPKTITDDDVFAFRKLLVSLYEYACDGSRGAPQGSARYMEIVEGRRYDLCNPPSSSCGDQPHWGLYMAGIRLDWINRDAHTGWTYGTKANGWRNNITTLYHDTFNQLAEPWRDGMRFEPGDAGGIWDDSRPNHTHVFCVIDQGDDGVLLTAEYGQPGGKLLTRAIRDGRLCTQRPGGIFKKGRMIQFRLDAGKVFRAAHRAGKLAPALDPTRAEDGTLIWSP